MDHQTTDIIEIALRHGVKFRVGSFVDCPNKDINGCRRSLGFLSGSHFGPPSVIGDPTIHV